MFKCFILTFQILHNLENGLCEDGSPAELSVADRNESKKLWRNREARVLHSIVNCAIYQKVSHLFTYQLL